MTKTNDNNRKQNTSNVKQLNQDGWRINQDKNGVLRWFNLFHNDYDESDMKVKYLNQNESEVN